MMAFNPVSIRPLQGENMMVSWYDASIQIPYHPDHDLLF